MDSDSFTQKTSEAFLSARDIAAQRNHQYVEPIHLLAGLLAQTDGLLSRQMLDGTFQDGDSIEVVVAGDDLAFHGP